MKGARRLRIFVLIDALGWTYVEDSRFLADLLPYRSPLRTFLGYSSGAVPTILTGVPPVQHGHWNLFYRNPAGSPFRWLRALRFLPDAALNHRVTRKLLKEAGRRFLGLGPLFECAVSPRLLPELDWIEKRNIYAPGGIPGTPSIFDLLVDQQIPHRVYSYHQWTDAQILRQAGRDIESSDAMFFFLYLSEMDALLHSQCQDRAAWQGRLEWYAEGLRELLSAARRVDPDATLTVFSDHGMTPVRHHYDLAAHVGRLGLKMPDDYLAVYDSTMARFWFFSRHAESRIVDRLHTVPCGRVLSNDELRDLGIFFPDRRYGEVVFLLKPGWLLSNSDFNGNGWRPAGMHGYHPDDPYSDGACLSTHKSEMELRTIADAYRCMREAVPADAAMEGQHAP